MGSGSRVGRREVACRRGKVGSSCGLGPGSAGRGLLIRLRRPVLVPDPREGGGRSESGRALVALDEESGVHGEASETTWPSSRAYHDKSSSSSPSEDGAGVNLKTSAGLASDASTAVVDLVITRGWIFTRWAAGALQSSGLGSRPGQSSSDVSGVVGISVLEQADMLVREGVGERERGGDPCRRLSGRVGRGGVVTMLLLNSARGGESQTGEVMSITMSKALRRTE